MSSILTTNEWIHSAEAFESGALEGQAVVAGGKLTLAGHGKGVLISAPIDAGQAVAWERIFWDIEHGGRGRVRVRTRFASSVEELESARWSAPCTRSGARVRIQGSDPMALAWAAARFIQYRIELAAANGPLPAVSTVKVTCRLVQPSGFWPADLAQAHPDELVFRWLSVRGADHYQLQVAPASEFDKGVRRFGPIRATEFVPPKDSLPQVGAFWWRVRAADGMGKLSRYSSPRCVFISDRRLTDEYNYAQHPRLFFNSAELEALREKIKSDPRAAEVFAQIKAKADESLDAEMPSEEEVLGQPGQHGGFHQLNAEVTRGRLEPLAFTYLITEDDRYADAARRIMLKLVAYSRWLGLQFGDRNCFNPPWSATLETGGMCKGIATAYDWLYNWLSDEDRNVIREGLVRLGIRPLVRDWANPDTYSQIERHQLAAGNWHAVCNSGAGIAALAVLGEEPEAQLWVRLVEDAIRWYFVYRGCDVWNIHCLAADGFEYLAYTEPNWGEDAGYVESIGYIHYGLVNAMYFVDALKRVTGADLSPDIRKDILDEPLYGLFHDSDRGYVMVNFNDSGDGSNLSSDIYSLIARYTRNPKVQWMLDETRGGFDSIHSLLAHDPSVAAESPESLPKFRHFRDIGWVIFRTGWGKSDSLFAVKFHQGRGHEDLGQFVIYHRGRQLIIDPGVIPYADPIYQTFLKQTKAHNVIMIDGQHQLRLDGKITDFLSADGAGLAAADLTGAYQDIVSSWHRGVAFLDDGIYIVWDRLRADDPHTYSWLLHPKGEFQVEDGKVSMGDGGTGLNLWLLSSSRPEIETLPGYIGSEEHPYLSFNLAGRGNADFLGVFADGSFSISRRLGKTAAEIASADKKCLVCMGKYADPVVRFDGEMLAAVYGASSDAPEKFVAYRCRNLDMPGVSFSARRPVNLIGIRRGDTYVIRRSDE